MGGGSKPPLSGGCYFCAWEAFHSQHFYPALVILVTCLPALPACLFSCLSCLQEEQRSLLKFVTSCSRAPLGGFQHLNPPLTIHKVGAKLPACMLCNVLRLAGLFVNSKCGPQMEARIAISCC